MEIDYNQSGIGSTTEAEYEKDLISVRAIITCPTCSYKKVFKNQFNYKELESMVVTIKCFDWLTCTKCGELLNLNMEFKL